MDGVLVPARGVEVRVGDARALLAAIPAGTAQTCITSPPYYGLRDYGADGQIGAEDDPRGYVRALVEVFREVRRVLRPDGTLWVNLGDAYAGSWGARGRGDHTRAPRPDLVRRFGAAAPARAGFREINIKPKDLMGLPWRVALALQEDGWLLRQEIIWHKPNPAPESARDRFPRDHEHLFLLAPGPRYYLAPGDAFGDGRRARTVWSLPVSRGADGHPAPMPEALAAACVRAGSRPGDMVLDPFGGSGTTAIAALKHGRRAVICELNPEYAALAARRIGAAAARAENEAA